ncbi:MAG: hypothetical protein EOO08_03465 [Chitinophagaceae bacterium]|nr:MAG: hypothetical protein EOO08_03465 [Chitinophagaceae bacterium]
MALAAAPGKREKPVVGNNAPGVSGTPIPRADFLPQDLEADELEAEDLAWLLARQKQKLQKAETAGLQRESAARLAEIEDLHEDLFTRVRQLQSRMDAWKEALLEREGLKLLYEQLQGDHLDQQYTLGHLRSENERLRLELEEARNEALHEYEETERLKTQLALLRDLAREEEGF